MLEIMYFIFRFVTRAMSIGYLRSRFVVTIAENRLKTRVMTIIEKRDSLDFLMTFFFFFQLRRNKFWRAISFANFKGREKGRGNFAWRISKSISLDNSNDDQSIHREKITSLSFTSRVLSWID